MPPRRLPMGKSSTSATLHLPPHVRTPS
ncbi:hypothetical protein E2C01_099239 [Portunus trituberculatus]|uniref:Uncharacterized protein n=1 Tax=Portunus trituberculatus TaxID=210409 RepID=A0A5B7KEE1_PORTR|nr:hypothetical protein [Portunus trituberculatus]